MTGVRLFFDKKYMKAEEMLKKNGPISTPWQPQPVTVSTLLRLSCHSPKRILIRQSGAYSMLRN